MAAELAGDYDVTTETVRRDLAALEAMGLVRRVHGGAVPASALTSLEHGLAERDASRPAEKDAIARFSSRGPNPIKDANGNPLLKPDVTAPGVNVANVQDCISGLESGENAGIYNLINLFSGGALLQLSIFALGIMPYITASIIVQLLVVVIPRFEQLKKEGQSGQAKLTQYTRYLTIALAVLQSTGIIALARSGQLFPNCPESIIPSDSVWTTVVLVVALTAGTALIMWLGELITENGMGNGISVIIFGGIVSQLPTIVAQGLRCVIGDEVLPGGRLDPAAYATIADAYEEIERLEALANTIELAWALLDLAQAQWALRGGATGRRAWRAAGSTRPTQARRAAGSRSPGRRTRCSCRGFRADARRAR